MLYKVWREGQSLAGVCVCVGGGEVWGCVWVGLLCTHFIVLLTAVHLGNKSLVGAQNLFVFIFTLMYLKSLKQMTILVCFQGKIPSHYCSVSVCLCTHRRDCCQCSELWRGPQKRHCDELSAVFCGSSPRPATTP